MERDADYQGERVNENDEILREFLVESNERVTEILDIKSLIRSEETVLFGQTAQELRSGIVEVTA